MNFILLTILLLASASAFAQDQQQDIAAFVQKMQSQLDLSQEQVGEVTAIIEKYAPQFAALRQSVKNNSINPSAVDSQRQGLEADETQDLSQYLKPNQLSEWRQMQAVMDQQGAQTGDSDNDSDQYSNLPNNPSSGN